MNLTEAMPVNVDVAKYVDRYQFFDIDKPSFLKALPNGKIEAYIILAGGFEILDISTNKFKPVKKFGVLPATNKASLLRISSKLVCLNIKMHLNVLSIPAIQEGYFKSKGFPSNHFISQEAVSSMLVNNNLSRTTVDSAMLDQHMLNTFKSLNKSRNADIEKVLTEMLSLKAFSVKSLADKMNTSPKTLERVIKRHFNFTPKALWSILRFEQTTSFLKKTKTQKLVDALSFGYYDQSHFNKECKRITGSSPKALFAKMDLPTNDLMVYLTDKQRDGIADLR